MASLYFQTRRMELPAHFRNIDDLKASIVPVLTQNHFSSVVNTQSEVAGNRRDIRLAVLHLHIGGRSYYQQVMAAGDDFEITKAVAKDVAAQIAV